MIEKLKISKWSYWVTLVLILNALLSLLYFVFPKSSILEYPFGLTIYSLPVSILLIVLIFLNFLFNTNSRNLRQVIILILNLFISILGYYYLIHLYDNFVIS